MVMGIKVYVHAWDDLKREILDKACNSAYALHPKSMKMYHTLQEFYWWPWMKKEIVEFVAWCLDC